MRIRNENLTRREMNRPDYEIFLFDDYYQNNVPVHYHDFYEIYLFLSGEVIYNLEGNQFPLKPGSLLLIPPNVMHWPLFLNKDISYKRLFIWVTEAYLASLSSETTDLTACFTAAPVQHFFQLEPDIVQDFLMLSSRLLALPKGDEYGKDLRARSLMTLLMLNVHTAVHNFSPAESENVRQSTRVHEVIDYINDHLSEKLNLESLAAQFFISKSYLSRIFLEQTGINVHQYITKRRMVQALQLLRAGNAAKDFFFTLGYVDYSAFYRAFQQEFGINPSQARESRQE